MNEWYETRMWITSTVSARAGRKRFLNFSVLHNVSQEIAGLHFLDRVPGYDLQPLHQRPVLFRRDLQRLFFCTGPAETAKLQPFVEEKESVPFPDQPFNAVTRLPQNRKRISFSYGSSWKLNFTMDASPSMPRRRMRCQ